MAAICDHDDIDILLDDGRGLSSKLVASVQTFLAGFGLPVWAQGIHGLVLSHRLVVLIRKVSSDSAAAAAL